MKVLLHLIQFQLEGILQTLSQRQLINGQLFLRVINYMRVNASIIAGKDYMKPQIFLHNNFTKDSLFFSNAD